MLHVSVESQPSGHAVSSSAASGMYNSAMSFHDTPNRPAATATPVNYTRMLSRHATMGLLLLRATSTLAWAPGAFRSNRSGRFAAGVCGRCRSSTSTATATTAAPVHRSWSNSRGSSSRGSLRTFATTSTTKTGEAVDSEDGAKQGSNSDVTGSGELPAGTASRVSSGEGEDSTSTVIEIQPLLQRHMEILGSPTGKKCVRIQREFTGITVLSCHCRKSFCVHKLPVPRAWRFHAEIRCNVCNMSRCFPLECLASQSIGLQRWQHARVILAQRLRMQSTVAFSCTHVATIFHHHAELQDGAEHLIRREMACGQTCNTSARIKRSPRPPPHDHGVPLLPLASPCPFRPGARLGSTLTPSQPRSRSRSSCQHVGSNRRFEIPRRRCWWISVCTDLAIERSGFCPIGYAVSISI